MYEGQASSPNGLTAWLSRLGLVAVGALGYAIVQPWIAPPPVVPPPSSAPTKAECSVSPEAVAPPETGVPSEPTLAQLSPGSPLGVTKSNALRPPPEVTAADPNPPAAAPVQDAATPEASKKSPAVSPGPAPDFPLPRMPGCNKLSSHEKYDAEKDAWVLTRAYEAPASTDLIVRFYRKALRDLDLELTEGKGAPAEDGSVRVFVKGRKDGAAAQVSIRQVPGEFDSRIRVIWRQWE